jgi:hypothetical protein
VRCWPVIYEAASLARNRIARLFHRLRQATHRDATGCEIGPPSGCSRMSWIASRKDKNVLRVVTACMMSHSDSGMVMVSALRRQAARLANTSSVPKRVLALAKRRATYLSSAMSQAADAAPTAPAATFAASPSRSTTRTSAPACANNSAVARPIPAAAPVTIALFLSSLKGANARLPAVEIVHLHTTYLVSAKLYGHGLNRLRSRTQFHGVAISFRVVMDESGFDGLAG